MTNEQGAMSNAGFLVAVHEARELEQQHGIDHSLTKQAIQRAYAAMPEWQIDELEPEHQRHVRFCKACARLEDAKAAHGVDSPEVNAAMVLCMEYAPDELHNAMVAKMEAMFELPQASAYDDNGNPLYSLHDVAQALGVSEQEAEEDMHSMLAAHKAAGLPIEGRIITDPAKVHTVQ